MADDDLPQFDLNSPEYQAKMREQRRANQARREREAEETRKRFELGKLNMLKNDFAAWPMEAQYNVKDLTYHVTMTEGGLAPIASDAKARADKEFKRGIRNYATSYKMGPAKVNLNLYGRDCMIHVGSEDVLAFEFATSGNPVKIVTETFDGSTPTTGTSNGYDYITVIVEAVKRDRSIQTTARIGGRQRSRYAEENSLDPVQTSLIYAWRQVQGLSEPRAYPFPVDRMGHQITPSIIGWAYDPQDSFEGAYHLSTLIPTSNYARWPLSMDSGGLSGGRDIDYDLPWWYSEDASAMRIGHLTLPNTDWPRAGGMQEVDSQWGKRRFAIMITATDEVRVFPVDAILAITPENFGPVWTWDDATVPDQYVQSLTPTFPAWVWRGFDSTTAYESFTAGNDEAGRTIGLDEWREKHNQHRWEFNHDGTKAAAVMFHYKPFTNDATFFSANADLNTPWTATQFAELKGTMGSTYGGGWRRADDRDRYFVAPGVIEMTFDITITGPDLEDFTVTSNITSVRAPESTNYPTVAVGYVWRDVTCNGIKIAQGHMIALSLMLYTRCGRKDTGKHELKSADRTALWVLHDITAGNQEIFSIISDEKNYTRNLLLKTDMASCSFLFLTHWRQIIYTTTDRAKGILHPAILPIVNGVTQTLILPETMPADVQEVMRGAVNLNGYSTISRVTAPEYAFQPMNQPYDDYSESTVTGILNLRDVWAFDWQSQYYDWYVFPVDTNDRIHYYLHNGELRYKNDPTNFGANEPTFTAAGEEMMGELYVAMEKAWRVCMFCTAPKFGWHMYSYLLWDHLLTSAWITFGVHAPSGTWALWSNMLMYDQNGLPYIWDGFAWTHETSFATLSEYTTDKLEHWIVDRLHIEFQTDEKTTGAFDTTFMEQYNRAVRAAKDHPDPALRLKGDIREMTLADQRGRFTKETSVRPFYPGVTRMLALKCEWNGKTGWLHDELVHDAPSYAGGITMLGWGALKNPILLGWWAAEQNRSGSAIIPIEFGMAGTWCADAPAEWHIRFYDPTVIMTRNQ